MALKMQRVKATHNFQNKREVPALHESCVQNVKKQPTIALQTFWVKCFSLNHSAQSAQKCMAVNAFGYHLFFETLSGLGGKESEVLNFLVCAMRNSDNTYTGPMKKIAENVNCSKATVQRAMDTLTDKGFVAMEFDCVWRINPSMVIKGNRNKEKVLMDEFLATQKEYDKKRKARKNGKKQKTVKG